MKFFRDFFGERGLTFFGQGDIMEVSGGWSPERPPTVAPNIGCRNGARNKDLLVYLFGMQSAI